ncbi:stage II sporulation protein D [Halanaerobacter jeridensis]|uniref:Stage II sporulation protein D n=1 Tax=Halanaerobacter jeridensis TaxID=706427 RepID=A0A939BR46_9FIRM|nr:stage II sporulation protein D [Halanaerobacter jeridensis]
MILSIWLLSLILMPSGLVLLINLIESKPQITVYDYKLQQEKTLPLEEYVKGVVAAEMPASFPLEALKAQAVAARTYALKKEINGQRLTTSSKFDQAWLSKQELKNKWTTDNFFYNWSKISTAVEETAGLVLVYNDELITAAYHSTSGGRTAAAVEVWGGKIPYLKSVNSYCENNSPYYNQQQFFTWQQLAKNLDSINYKQVQIISRSNSGRVLKMKINKQVFSGREIRKKLALNSTKFRFIKTELGIKFIVDGFGHGVGMSQYGAQGLAEEGCNFIEILYHYYPQAKVIVGKNDFDV